MVFLSLSKATVLWETQDLGTGHIPVSEQEGFTFSVQKNKHLIIEAVPLLYVWEGPTHSCCGLSPFESMVYAAVFTDNAKEDSDFLI